MAFNILIVDDSQTIRNVIARTLQIIDVPVGKLLHASNGKEALELLKDEWVDMIFADINMPVMGGIEMINHIKEDEAICDIPIVVISTEGSATRIHELKERGIKAFIRKPFTPEQVNSVINEVLGA